MRNARRQGGSQGPKSCASLSIEKRARSLDAAMAAAIAGALAPQPGEANQDLESRRDLLAAARALYSTTWLASTARCTLRRAQQIMAQRLVWMARCGDFWGFDDLPALRECALRQAKQAEPVKAEGQRAARAQEQLCLFEGEEFAK
ncbi:hypothetical protein [Thiomonas sp.]